MIRNYIKISLRNLKRFRFYTFINLVGMSIGLSISILILLFVQDELGYDRMHENGKRIYKVVSNNLDGGIMETNAWPVAQLLGNEYPEVEAYTYTRKASSTMKISYEGKQYDHNIFYADNGFFNIFSFPFIEGDPANALNASNQIVITEAMRQRYFGNDVALGKQLIFRDSIPFEVTGVIKDIPSQSHIQFEMMMSFKTYEMLDPRFSYTDGWGNFNVRNYILLREGADVVGFQSKIKSIYTDNIGDFLDEMGVKIDLAIMPLFDIYLSDNVGNGFGPTGSLSKVYLVAGMGIFVLLLACINFINLTTARSVYRASEVGIRKIVGSTRQTLVLQFMGESLILTLLSLFAAFILIDLTLPFFNMLMGKSYELINLFTPSLIASSLILVMLVSILAGFYPALVMSSYQPVEVLGGKMKTGSRGVNLRRVLVVFQFFISSGLVIATLIVLNQLDFMRNQDLGFDKEQVLVLDMSRVPRSASIEAFSNGLATLPSVKVVSLTNALPGRPGWLGQWAYPGDKEDADQVDTEYMAIDHNYIDLLGLELLAGENFTKDKNMQDLLIINETTVKEMGWSSPEEAIGKMITSPSTQPQGRVIGVVKDYHNLGLRDKIWPQAMEYTAHQFGRYYAIKFMTGATSNLISQTKELWSTYMGDSTFEYFFLDDSFDAQYKAEDRLMSVLILFAIINMIIAVIGLLGLVSFMVLTKTREISIRKVMGASRISLASMLSREFTYLILIANLLIIPVIWHYGEQWLNDFAYHTDINPLIFVYSVIATLGIAFITVSFQTLKAASVNPAETLKSQ